MKIYENSEGARVILELEGNLDENTSAMVEKKLGSLLKSDTLNIDLDMSRVNYISSIGICALVASYKRAVKSRKKITIIKMSDKVDNILSSVGLLALFK